MIDEKEIVYKGEQAERDFKVWGVPFHFVSGKPTRLQANIARILLNNNKLFSDYSGKEKLFNRIKTEVKAILVIRSLGGFGDVLMTTPVCRALKENYPNAEIHYTTPKLYMPMVENNPFVDKIIDWDTPTSDLGYDAVIDLTRPCHDYEIKTAPRVDKHRTDIFLAQAGVDTQNKLPIYFSTEQEKAEAKEYLGKDKYVGIGISSMATVRNWDIKNFYKLAWLIRKNTNYQVLVFNQDRVEGFTDCVEVFGKSIRQVGALIEQCKAFIGLDSGLTHFAGALNVPSLALFGNIDPLCRISYYPRSKAIVAGLACQPCWRADCVNVQCLRQITPEKVFEEFENLCV